MATFADLMSLLLCFFVLLLSMSQIDSFKYKTVIKSMRDAFGASPTTSQLAFYQQSAQTRANAIIQPEVTHFQAASEPAKSTQSDTQTISQWLQQQTQSLHQLLQTQIDKQQVSVDKMDGRVVIRIHENASFPSGSAQLKTAIKPVLQKIAGALSNTHGKFIVAGHTDNRPLQAGRYRSNWELSAARASSVLHQLLLDSGLNSDKFRIEGYADTQPLKDNSTDANRAVNRRVEIAIIPPQITS